MKKILLLLIVAASFTACTSTPTVEENATSTIFVEQKVNEFIKANPDWAKDETIQEATTEKFKTASGEVKENTEWHNIVFWGTLSDVIEKYVKKGSMLYIEGKITSRSYESGGEKKYITEIVGNSIQLLDKKS